MYIYIEKVWCRRTCRSAGLKGPPPRAPSRRRSLKLPRPESAEVLGWTTRARVRGGDQAKLPRVLGAWPKLYVLAPAMEAVTWMLKLPAWEPPAPLFLAGTATRTHTHSHTHMWAHTGTHTHRHTHTRAHAGTHTHTHIHTHTRTRGHTRARTHLCC